VLVSSLGRMMVELVYGRAWWLGHGGREQRPTLDSAGGLIGSPQRPRPILTKLSPKERAVSRHRVPSLSRKLFDIVAAGFSIAKTGDAGKPERA